MGNEHDDMKIRDATAADAAGICEIYNWYVVNTIITFEEQPVSVAEMQRRIAGAGPLRPWVVLERAGRLLGYAYAGEWKARSAYRYAAETTVYVDQTCRGEGIGSRLYVELLCRVRETPLHTLMAGIALPNPHSVALHEKMGFVKVAHFRQTGWKFGQWIDVGYWELVLENSRTPEVPGATGAGLR